MFRSISQGDGHGDKHEEGKKIVEELAKLKYEVQHDRSLLCVLLPLSH